MNNSSTRGRELPMFVRDLLAAPPERGGGLNIWLFKIARAMHPFRDHDEIVKVLEVATMNLPVKSGEIERAVRNSKSAAWNPEAPRPAARPKTWPSVNLEQREAIIAQEGGLCDLWEASPVRFEDSESHTEEIINALFPFNSLLCIGKSNREFATLPRDSWRGRYAGMQLIVPSPMSSRKGLTREGKESEHTLANTGPRRFLVIEQDQGTPDEQAAILLHLAKRAPLALAVHSGSKSIHGWFYCGTQTEEFLRRFMAGCVELGGDPATWTRSQFVRLPGGTRDNGARQIVYFFNPYLIK